MKGCDILRMVNKGKRMKTFSMEKFKSRIKKSLCQYNVIFGYLFGSRAIGQPGALSDVDIAIFLDHKITCSAYLEIKLALINEFSKIFDCNRVDIVLLNESRSAELNFNIIKNGIVIRDIQPSERYKFESRIMQEYFETKFMREEYAGSLLENIKMRGIVNGR